MWKCYLLGALLAIGGGSMPCGRLPRPLWAPGVPLERLAGSPFRDYFVPSLILFVAVGGAFSIAAVAVPARLRVARVSALVAGKS